MNPLLCQQGQLASRSGAIATRDAEFNDLVTKVASKHAPATPTTPSLWVSLSPMVSTVCVPVHIAQQSLADFLNEVGIATKMASFPDVQVWLQRRASKGMGDADLWGIVIDYDQPMDDPLAAHVESGQRVPNLIWPTQNGHRAAYVFDRAADRETFERIGKQFTLALVGGDPSSWLASQGQRLPTCWKTTQTGLVPVDFSALTTNPSVLAVGESRAMLPARVARLFVGVDKLTDAERAIVEAYLDEIGSPAPAQPGERVLHRACPLDDSHDSACAYVNRRNDGTLYVFCLGGHSGEGRKHWTERDLYELASGEMTRAAKLDVVRDLPPTWAGVELLQHHLAAAFANEKQADALVQASIDLWKQARAQVDVDTWHKRASSMGLPIAKSPTVANFLELYDERLRGFRGAGPFRLFFDEQRAMLRMLQRGGTSLPLRATGDSLSPKNHKHEWRATTAYNIVPEVMKDGDDRVIVWAKQEDESFASEFNKTLYGHPGCLKVVGLPKILSYDFPVAFAKDDTTIDLNDKLIRMVRVATPSEGDPNFDVLGFFTRLYRAGRLPLASESDVPRLVMAIASPLLRAIAPGLLGVYWLVGSPGAGKDFLAELIADLWHVAGASGAKAKFDLAATDDLESKRGFASAGGAIYARVKEAAKRRGIIDLLIRFAGTDVVAARGMRENEVSVPNSFTYLAESAEDLPNRKEVSRRTVILGVQRVDDTKVSLGAVRAEVLAHAADIVTSLKATIESKPPEWFLQQTNTGLRPVIPVALANLFGAELPVVSGRDLEDLWEAIADYVKTPHAITEGNEQQAKARAKDGVEVKTFQSYRLTHFIDTMKSRPGVTQLFEEFRSSRAIELVLQREVDYANVKRAKHGYVPVPLGDAVYAFRLVKADRNFIFVPEAEFTTKIATATGASAPAATPLPLPASNYRQPIPPASSCLTLPQAPANGPLTVTAATLLAMAAAKHNGT